MEYTTERGVVFAQPEGTKLKCTMYLPRDDGESLRPGIVLIHGGGWMIGTRYQQLWYCQNFAKRGYVVMTVDYRMMPKYPFPHCLEDCKAAVRWLRANAAKYRVDPDYLATFGASAGGHLAAFLAVTTPEDGFEGTQNLGPSSEVKCAISLYGAVDLTQYRRLRRLKVFQPSAKSYIERFAGEVGEKQGRDPLAAASPITYATAGSRPIMFVHGMADFMVNYEQSAAFHDRLQELDVPTRLIGFPRRSHGFDYIHHRQRRKAFEGMVEFLDEHLGWPGKAETVVENLAATST
jgi:acetyl esterase/lipase